MNATLPNETEIRDAMARLTASAEFHASTQIVRFLSYIVEETLAGRGDRIKAYSVATEALGRPADFDPQTDTIVRVEANRLRRVLTEYYAGSGRHDTVVIHLTPGHYRPSFLRPDADAAVPVAPPPSAAPASPPRFRILALAIGLGVLLFALTVGARLALRYFDADTSAIPIPTVYVEPFSATGPPAAALGHGLREELQNALARFDEIRVIAGDSEDISRSAEIDYRLRADIDNAPGPQQRIDFQLIDESEKSVVWTKRLDGLPSQLDGATQTAIVRQVATGVADLYNVIGTREREKASIGALDPRYRCLIDALAFFRSFDPGQQERILTCLEAVTAANPTSVRVFHLLSRVYLREYFFGNQTPEGDARLLDLAYRAARAAVDAKPQSARAYQALMDAQYIRGEYEEALAAGDESRKLNPYDTVILGDYGARLLGIGRIEDGLALMREATALSESRPTWIDFLFVVGAIMVNDDATATRIANTVMNDAHPQTQIGRVVLAVRAGDLDAARRSMAGLDAAMPSFRANPRRTIEKFIHSKDIVDRLMDGLAPVLGAAAAAPAGRAQ